RHEADLGRVVHDLIDGYEREVPRHELDDRPQPGHGRTDADADEAALGDRRVDDALLAELLQHPLRHLVGALVMPDLLAHQEDRFIALHLFAHGLVERFAVAQTHRFYPTFRCEVGIFFLALRASGIAWSSASRYDKR